MNHRLLRLRVNGAERTVASPPHATLLDVLRDTLGLTGTKRGCDMGSCGGCAVLVDGRPLLSCLTLAATVEGRDVQTIESVGTPNHLHPVQKALVEAGGMQCGFCTPGVVMATLGLLARHPDPTEEQVREALSGNLCRCTGYAKIVAAVRSAAQAMRTEAVGGAPP